ncbi:MAG: pitrilysin family protein [bacterium]|nr:pitrilysin family protein [bacterium]
MINFEKRKLPNGLRVILAPFAGTEAATLLALIKTGSRNETKRISGISHFLEHMFFKGTKSRPEAGMVHKELDIIGADHNAFTSKETTGFWVKTAGKDFNVAIDIVSDILTEPLFKEEEMDKEKKVIFQEIDMYEDMPSRKVHDVLERLLYGDNPVGWNIAGGKETVAKISRSDLLRYEKENYVAGNMLVVAAGNINKNEVFEKIKKEFGGMRRGAAKSFKKFRMVQKEPAVDIVNKKTDQAHLTMAIRGYDMRDDKKYALNLLSVILGGNISSRLFSEIREKMGLAYYIYAWGDQYQDCGYLGIAAGVPNEELQNATGRIVSIIKDIKDNGVSEDELKDAKSYLRGQMSLKFEGSEEIASFVAGQEMFYNKIKQPHDILRKIEKLTAKNLSDVAKEIFTPERISMAAIGNVKNSDKDRDIYKKILKNI